MKRIAFTALVAGAVVAVVAVRAFGGGLAGNWTVQLYEQGTEFTYWVAKLHQKDGKLAGTVESADDEPPATLHDMRVDGDLMSFTIKERGKQGDVNYVFQGKIPPGGAGKILGSIAVGAGMVPARLERTSLVDLKGRPKAKELMSKPPEKRDAETLKTLRDDPLLFAVAQLMFRQAAEKKAASAEVGEWYNIASNAAAAYGPRWQRQFALRTAEDLARAKEYAVVTEQAAQRALDGADKADLETGLRALSALATALKNQSKLEGFAKVETSVEALESKAYAKHSKEALPFTPAKYVGRKDKGDRTVLVELFTGAQCPPCVAADLAFDGLSRTYSPREVVLLQYHEHIPGPDPLTNPDTNARMAYYERDSTPSILFNGKVPPENADHGGPPEAAGELYQEYRKVIDPVLEKRAPVRLEADAVRDGDKIHITARTSGVDKPGEKVRLRLVLVEEWVRYRGGNGLSYHHRIVRDMPGGPQGVALTADVGRQDVTVNVPALRGKLANYLDDFSKKEEVEFPGARPLRLRDLLVVAFIQNDATREVLQAVEVPIRVAGQK